MTGETSPSATTSPALPWRTKITIFFLTLVTDAVRRSDGTINRRLLSFLEISARPNPKPVRGVRTADITIDTARNLWFRLFLPADSSQGDGAGLPVLVFFHGGGFAFLSPASGVYDAVCRRFCRKFPAAVVSVNYRLSPEHRYPAQYDDGLEVLRFLASQPGGGDCGLPLLQEFFKVADLSSCFLAGDSAGANIAHHVARRWSGGEAPPRSLVAVAGLVAIQPFFGGDGRVESEIRLSRAPVVSAARTDWLWRAFLPEGVGRDHEAASPEGAVSGLSEDFPPAMVVIGGFDPLQDWQRKYYEGLRRVGKEARLVEYPGAIHAFYVFPELKDTPALIEELKGFIQEQRKKSQQQGRPTPLAGDRAEEAAQ
ncbi:hypothetical protein Taro_008675 [Colocasia esculenta]|uniref:Alpha/beta hydrolase fold-3 domain-containing protein n=1 Tax=Colocasia esculenta TaxID=4460 RepID=A0A843U441_COLES|nr:hypothetical protein [Colocasia esculenta]